MMTQLMEHHSALVIQVTLVSLAALAALSSWARHRSVIRAAGAAIAGYLVLPLLAIALAFALLGGAASSYSPRSSHRW